MAAVAAAVDLPEVVEVEVEVEAGRSPEAVGPDPAFLNQPKLRGPHPQEPGIEKCETVSGTASGGTSLGKPLVHTPGKE